MPVSMMATVTPAPREPSDDHTFGALMSVMLAPSASACIGMSATTRLT